jgi:iron complex outermembrane recepter protein
VTDGWTVGGTGVAASGQFLFGNEANLTAKTPADFVFNLHTSYQLTPTLQLFGLIENAFNTTYYTFGTFSPTSSVPIVQAPGAANPAQLQPWRNDCRDRWHPHDVLINDVAEPPA